MKPTPDTDRNLAALPIVAFDADKTVTILDHLFDTYFPTDNVQDKDLLAFEYPRIRNLIAVARDYADRISAGTHQAADRL